MIIDKQQAEASGLLDLLETAATLLSHPEVVKIPFALNSQVVADKLRQFIWDVKAQA